MLLGLRLSLVEVWFHCSSAWFQSDSGLILLLLLDGEKRETVSCRMSVRVGDYLLACCRAEINLRLERVGLA